MMRIIARFTKNRLVQGFGNLITLFLRTRNSWHTRNRFTLQAKTSEWAAWSKPSNLVEEVQRVRLELQKTSEHKTKGAIIGSRAKWYEHGEKNSKYFVNLEKRAYERKHIVKLKTQENQYLEEPKKILCQMENFYKTLYSSQISDDTLFYCRSRIALR